MGESKVSECRIKEEQKLRAQILIVNPLYRPVYVEDMNQLQSGQCSKIIRDTEKSERISVQSTVYTEDETLSICTILTSQP